jgi:hypothetical protein
MTLLQLLPSVSALPHAEKVQLMQWLAEQLAREEGISPFISGEEHAVWSPFDSYEAAADLGRFLEQEKKALGQ